MTNTRRQQHRHPCASLGRIHPPAMPQSRPRMLRPEGRRRIAMACLVMGGAWITGVGAGAAPAAKGAAAKTNGPVAKSATPVVLRGAGAISPALLYDEWSRHYEKATGVRVEYNAVGSRGGINTIMMGFGDFGAIDRALAPIEAAVMRRVVVVPTTICPVAVIYNVPGVEFGLHLTPEVIADIYLGKITQWNDPHICAINPKSKMPNLAITPWYRAEGGTTTEIFTQWLCLASPEWEIKVGSGFRVRWPKGMAAYFGGPNMVGGVLQTPGAIGYESYPYVSRNLVPYARLRNRHGRFVLPSPASGTAAALSPVGSGFPRDLVGVEARDGYPLCSFTYMLLYPNPKRELKAFLRWALTTGAKDAAPLGYAPLPAKITHEVLAKLDRLKPPAKPTGPSSRPRP